jgi:hypothetical protein
MGYKHAAVTTRYYVGTRIAGAACYFVSEVVFGSSSRKLLHSSSGNKTETTHQPQPLRFAFPARFGSSLEGNGVRPKSLSLSLGDAGIESFLSPGKNLTNPTKKEEEEGNWI